jgi:hypothetical protein
MNGGWWYTNNIIDYLNSNSVINKTIATTGTNDLTNELQNNNILILCLDMYYILLEQNEAWRTDKFYEAQTIGWGHFIVVKGYKKVDDVLYFEVYDPFNWGMTYDDGSAKGKNRYYKASDIMEATENWWAYAIVVSHSEFKSAEGVDPSSIRHTKGK